MAASDTAINPSVIAAKIKGSVALTSNRRLFSTPVSANAPAIPTASPIATGVEPYRTTNASTSPRVAPSAIRMPISRRR